MLASVFDSRANLFHMVFNNSVENFHRAFTKLRNQVLGLASQLLCRATSRRRALQDSFYRSFHLARAQEISWARPRAIILASFKMPAESK